MKIHIKITGVKRELLLSLKEKDGRPMNWHVNKAIDNYLIYKKAGKDDQEKP